MINTLKKKLTKDYDSCIVEVPKAFALANGFPEKCFVSLTLRNNKLESEIVEYFDQDEKEAEEFLNDFPNIDEELKQIGG